MSNECEHGQLARSCNICEYEREIAELQAQVADLTKDGYAWMAHAIQLKEQVAELTDENNLLREAVHGVERIILRLFANTLDKGEV